ncbi:MAG: ABC transporter permease [Arenicellales bacterium]|nr:ABC transporter permease [Arenicellales bacterium]
MAGVLWLFWKELVRFSKVAFQTVMAPIITSLLFLVVFSHVLEGRVTVYEGVSYTEFLVPGLIMMSVIQNGFANSSSSLIQSKITGNLVFVLITPISYFEFFVAYVAASIVRGLMVGAGILLVALILVDVPVHSLTVIVTFALLASAILGALGIIAAIWADRYDQMAAFQNFIIMPLSFLSGVFYSIHSLPSFWQTLSQFNPFFYMIDGFRYGFFGVSDVPITTSLSICLIALTLLSSLTLVILKSGYKLRA